MTTPPPPLCGAVHPDRGWTCILSPHSVVEHPETPAGALLHCDQNGNIWTPDGSEPQIIIEYEALTRHQVVLPYSEIRERMGLIGTSDNDTPYRVARLMSPDDMLLLHLECVSEEVSDSNCQLKTINGTPPGDW